MVSRICVFISFWEFHQFLHVLEPIKNLGLKKRKRFQKQLLCLVALRRAVLASELAVCNFLLFFHGFTDCGVDTISNSDSSLTKSFNARLCFGSAGNDAHAGPSEGGPGTKAVAMVHLQRH